MTPLQITEQLRAAAPGARDRLLRLAAEQPECLGLLLAEARAALAASPPEALLLAESAVLVAEMAPPSAASAGAWRVQAQALRVLGRHAEALSAFDGAASCALRAGEDRLAAQVRIGQIDSLAMLGHHAEAIALASRLEQELRALGAEEDAAKVLFNIGSIHFRRDEYDAALGCYERAGAIFARAGDPVIHARVQSNCANVLTHLNRVDEAIGLYEQARAAFADAGLVPDAAVVDTNTGFLHFVSGRHAAALASLSRARREFAVRERALDAAKADADMADVYRALNLHPEALECFDRAIAAFETAGVDYERARAELGRAAVLAQLGRPADAFAALARADAVFQAQKNPLQQAHVRLARAYLLRGQGEAAAVREATLAARAFARRGLPDWAAEARFLPAEAALATGRNTARRMESVLRTAQKHGRGWLACRAAHALGLHAARHGDARRALRLLRLGVATLEQAGTLVVPEELHLAFLRDKLGIYEDLIAMLLVRGRPGDTDEALEYVERSKSRLLLERIQTSLDARPGAGGGGASPAQKKLAGLRAELCRAYHQVHDLQDGRDSRFVGIGPLGSEVLPPLERAYHAALREAELDAQALGADATTAPVPAVATTDALRDALGPDEALVEFYIAHGSVCAFVLDRTQVRVRRDIARLDDVLHAARRLRYHLQKIDLMAGHPQRHAGQLHHGVQDVLATLYNLLLQPVEDLLPCGQLVIVPHGVLHGLPFHAFFHDGAYALDRWECVYAPSAAVWHAGVRRAAAPPTHGLGRRPLVLGVPGPGIERVADEVEALARILPGARLFCGDGATAEAFRAHAGEADLIHLATHALFRADNPLFSGLRFADGWLLARDLYEMTLDCGLATLSACRTGVAFVEAGDELFGLLRGFLAAGVRSLAASLWPADDAATAALMVLFYTRLGRGEPKAAALRAAQRELRAAYPHPYHWAPFALIGER